MRLETTEVFVGDLGDVATEVGRYRFVRRDVAGDEGTYIVIWARTADGWKRYRHMWASDRATPGP